MSGLLRAGLGRHREALLEFGAAEYPGSQLEGWHSLASQVTGWMLDRSALYGVLAEIEALGLDLIGVPISGRNTNHKNQVMAAHRDSR